VGYVQIAQGLLDTKNYGYTRYGYTRKETGRRKSDIAKLFHIKPKQGKGVN